MAIIVAILIPGYAWVSFAEKRRVRPARSGLLDAVDVVVVGVAATVLAGLAVAGLGEVTSLLPDLRGLSSDSTAYFQGDPWRIVLAILLAVVLAGCGAAIAVRLRYWKQGETVHFESVWRRVFSFNDTTAVRVAIELTTGDIVEGYLLEYSLDADGSRDLAIQQPIRIHFAGASEPEQQPGIDVLIIPGSEIRLISVVYIDDPRSFVARGSGGKDAG
ncbi:MAG TPA: hypothetical protein ENH00_13570 [Actinobacteria bacterium]|nr:hypothetical protein [Actinomycetota bacterium]